MAIAYDTSTQNTAYAATGTQSLIYAANASAKAAVVLIVQEGTTTDEVSGVTYGGAAMTRLRFDTEATEAGACYIYWLSPIAGGTKTVAMTTTGSTSKRLVVGTMTAAGNIVVAGHDTGSSASMVNPGWSITGLTTGDVVVAWECIHSGLNSMTSTPLNSPAWTIIGVAEDFGVTGRGWARITNTVVSGFLECGWLAATADDFVGSAVAFKEIPAWASVTPAGADHAKGPLSITRALASTGARASADAPGTLTVTRAGVARTLASTVGNAAGATGSLARARALAGQAPAADAASATLIRARQLASTLPNAAHVSGLITTVRALAAQAASASSSTGSLALVRAVLGKAAAATSGLATLGRARPLASTTSAADAATGTVRRASALLGSASATDAARADLIVTPRGVVVLPLAGVAQVAASAKASGLDRTRALGAQAGATNGARGLVIITRPLAGLAPAASTATARVRLARPIAGTARAAAGASADLSRGRALLAHLGIAAQASARLTLGLALSGQATAADLARGDLTYLQVGELIDILVRASMGARRWHATLTGDEHSETVQASARHWASETEPQR